MRDGATPLSIALFLSDGRTDLVDLLKQAGAKEKEKAPTKKKR